MNTTIEDKGSTRFKLTVTGNGDVRIKLTPDSDFATRSTIIKNLEKVAAEVIELHTGKTLRGRMGSCPLADTSLVMRNDAKGEKYRFQF